MTGWQTACRDHPCLFARRLGGKGSKGGRDSFDIANGVPEQPSGCLFRCSVCGNLGRAALRKLGVLAFGMFAGDIIAGAFLGSFTCLAPVHDNASTVRCANQPAIVRLMGIDTPAIPGSCKPGEYCPPGDPWAARDTLRALSLGRPLACEAEATDAEGRTLARCRVEGVDLSCAMLASGHAVPSRTAGDCDCAPMRPRPAVVQPGAFRKSLPVTGQIISMEAANAPPEPPSRGALSSLPLSDAPWSLPVAGAMVMIGLWMAMANLALLQLAHERWPSRQRWGAPMEKLDPWLFLGLAAAGASPAAWTALFTRHAGRQRDSLQSRLVGITGLQVGVVLGALWWCLFS